MFDILLTVNTPHTPSCKIVPLYPLIYSDRVLTTAYTYSPYTTSVWATSAIRTCSASSTARNSAG